MALTQQVQRVTLSGAATPVNFEYPSGKYLVKNYSSGDIYVSFESTCNPATSIRIVSGYGQVCEINERGGAAGLFCSTPLRSSPERTLLDFKRCSFAIEGYESIMLSKVDSTRKKWLGHQDSNPE